MKRSAIEKSLRELADSVRQWVERAPLQGLLAGVLAGICLVAIRGLLVPLAILAGIFVAALWVFGEEDRPEAAAFYEKKASEPPPVNGTASPNGEDTSGKRT